MFYTTSCVSRLFLFSANRICWSFWVTLITRLLLQRLNCFTLASNDFCCFAAVMSFLSYFAGVFVCVCELEEGLSNTTKQRHNREGDEKQAAFFASFLSDFDLVEDYDDTTTTMTSLCLITCFFFLSFLANFILVCIFKKLRTKANLSFFLVCNDVTMCLIIDFCFVLRMLNLFYLAV